ncbi:MAG: MFS transporter [Proteobacteria bacterium]|nr:MFS transporter [Pseudomonadota bacterium]
MMTILLAALDQTIVSVAVPTIAHQLGGFAWMAWVISGYLIASTAVTPLYGRYSDLYGRRRVMTVAIVLFLVASVGCAVAQSLPELVLARVLQGAGGGGLIASAQSVIADVVPLRQRGRYQGYISTVWAVASMLGPVIGGVLTEYLSWPWIFWINLPVGLAALVLVRRSLGALPVRRGQGRIDLLGALLLLAGLVALLIPITRVGQGVTWSHAGNLAGWTAAALLLAGFAWQQQRHPHAIVPVALLKNPTVVACCALLFICFFNFIALSVLVPLRLQLGAGYAPGDAALHLLPMTLAVPIAAFASGRWLFRTGRVLPAQRLGVLLVPIGLALAGGFAPTGVPAVAALVVIGFGMGLQIPTALITVQQSVPKPLIGTATALTAFFRLLGGAVGIAVLSSVTLLLLRGQLPAGTLGGGGLAGLLDQTLETHGAVHASDLPFRQVMWISAGVSLLGLLLVARLPDVRTHDAPAAARLAAHVD